MVHPAGCAPRVPAGAPGDGRGVRGQQWTDPANIVTNGPFMLESFEHEANDRHGQESRLARRGQRRAGADRRPHHHRRHHPRAGLRGRRGRRPRRRRPSARGDRAAEDGAVLRAVSVARDVLLRLQREEHLRHQRAARAVARDQPEDHHRQHRPDGPRPGHRHDPEGHARLRRHQPGVALASARGRHRAGEGAVRRRSQSPHKQINLFHNDSPGHKEIAVAVQDMWSELGVETTIKAQEWAQFLEFLGPPPNDEVDVYRLGWIYDFPDALNGLEVFICDDPPGSTNNSTNWCEPEYDALVDEARATPDEEARIGDLRPARGPDVRRGRRPADHADHVVHVSRTSRTTRFATRSSSARWIRSTSRRSWSRRARRPSASCKTARRGAPAPRRPSCCHLALFG